MTSFAITSPARAGWQPIADTSTTQRHDLGTIVEAVDATYGVGEFIYLQGVASTAIGNWVTYNADDWSTTLLVADALGPVGVAMSANVGSQYGWYQISGKAEGQCGTTVDSTILFIESSGIAADTSVAGDRIWSAVSAESIASQTLCDVEIHRPFVTNGEL